MVLQVERKDIVEPERTHAFKKKDYPEDCHGTLNFAYSWGKYAFVVVDSRTSNLYGYTISNTETKLFAVPRVSSIYLLTSGDMNTYMRVMRVLNEKIELALMYGVGIDVNWVCQAIYTCQTRKSAGFIVVGWNPGNDRPLICKVETSATKLEIGINPAKAGSAADLMGDFELSPGVNHEIGTVLNEVFTFCIPAAVEDPFSGGNLRGFVIGKETGMDLWYSSWIQ